MSSELYCLFEKIRDLERAQRRFSIDYVGSALVESLRDAQPVPLDSKVLDETRGAFADGVYTAPGEGLYRADLRYSVAAPTSSSAVRELLAVGLSFALAVDRGQGFKVVDNTGVGVGFGLVGDAVSASDQGDSGSLFVLQRLRRGDRLAALPIVGQSQQGLFYQLSLAIERVSA